MTSLEQTMRVGFAALDQSTRLPDSDQMSRILNQVLADPTVSLLRRTRRSIRTILWLCIFLFLLLGGSALVAVAYKALFEN